MKDTQQHRLSQSWQDRLKFFFSPSTLWRGEEYFRQGRVKLEKVTPTEVFATVEGTEEYAVELLGASASSGRGRFFCECPYFEGGNACKHLWATILAADAALAQQAEAPALVAQESPWRRLLFPAQAAQASERRWEGAPGQFLLRYELVINKSKLHLSAIKQKVLKSGSFGAQSGPAPHSILDEPDLPSTDRVILDTLLALYYRETYGGSSWSYRYSHFSGRKFDSYPLGTSTLSRLLPELLVTERCAVRLDGRVIAEPLRRGEPYSAALEFTLAKDSLDKRKKNLTYAPQVRLGESLREVADIPVFFGVTPLAFILDGRLYELPGPDLLWVQQIRRRKHVISVPKDEARELFQLQQAVAPSSSLELPKELGPTTLPEVVPVPSLELTILPNGLSARLWFDYAGFEIACDDPRPAILNIEDWTRLQRDAEAERELLHRLERLGINASASEFNPPHASVWEALDALEPLAEDGWTLRGRDKRKLKAGRPGTLRVKSELDWFDVEGEVNFGDAIVPLPKIIRAFLRGERTIELENGELGALPDAWLAKHAQELRLGLNDAGRSRDGKLRFHSAHALLLDELLDAADARTMDRDFMELRRRMKSFVGMTPSAPPQGFRGELRPYQREALGWFDFLGSFAFGGILADDMGLGKTIQALAWLALEKERGQNLGPTLVVAPTSLLFNWRDEAARFCPELRVLAYAGLERSEQADHFEEYDLVLTTYGLLRRDVETLGKTRWRCLILDESQAIKNPDSQTAKAARALPATRRLCMTGTPLENRLDELWSQMQFLNPNMLGSRKGFDARFGQPIAKGDSAARELLRRAIKPFVLRRTKESVAKDLPEKQESVLRCEMTVAQAKIYTRLHNHYRSEILATVDAYGLNQSRIKVLEGLLRMRQAACHPGLVGEEAAGSGKLEELCRIVREVVDEGHKALIFSQFTRFLTLIKKRLDEEGLAYEYLDGRTPAKTRASRVASFQKPSGPPVFCISLKAGGVGLNLTAADYVFIMDPWWNPAVEAQAVDRTHRIGQDKNVFAYRLISVGTIDEKVLKLQEQKRDLAEILAQGATTSISSLTREDLEALLA